MKNLKFIKIIAAVLAFTLAFTSADVLSVEAAAKNTEDTRSSQTAAENTEDARSSQTAAEKEEVVYGMLDAAGRVTGIYVVNIFSGQTDIVDYGDYSSVKNLTTTDPISFKNGMVTIKTDADKLYYQGNPDTTDLPWKIAIHYSMNGTEYTPEEIAGMSGALKITIEITQNKACDACFWEGYALQAALTLDSSMARNIVAEGATIANAGSDKKLSYIILPGKEKELEITADVTDFEMDAITINGVKLDLSVDYDDSELMDKVGEIQDAAEDLDQGASNLKEGAGDLYDGSASLSSGASALNTSMASLNSGISEIYSGLTQLNGKSDNLTGGSANVLTALKTIQSSLTGISLNVESLSNLSSASTRIKGGIDSLASGLQTMNQNIDNYYLALNQAGISDVSAFAEKNAQAAQTLSAINDGTYDSIIALLQADSGYISGSNHLISGISGSLDSENGALMTGVLALQTNYADFDTTIQNMAASLGSLAENMTTLKSGIDSLVTNYTQLNTGITDYTDAVAKIVAGYKKIYKGSGALATATDTLYEGTASLVDGTLALYNGTEDMSDGTTEFRDKTSDIDTQISDGIHETISDLTGSNVEIVSFVSDKNTGIDSVLFVIKTTAIEKETPEENAETEEAPSGFLEKFLALFTKE